MYVINYTPCLYGGEKIMKLLDKFQNPDDIFQWACPSYLFLTEVNKIGYISKKNI